MDRQQGGTEGIGRNEGKRGMTDRKNRAGEAGRKDRER